MIAEATTGILDSGLIQLGFAGFALITLSFAFWLVKQLLASNLRSDKVMAKLTEAINTLEISMASQLTSMKEEHSQIKHAQSETTAEVRKLSYALSTTNRGNNNA